MIIDFEFEGSDRLLVPAVEAAHWMAKLALPARAEKVPFIYVNDNFGKWKSDFKEQISRCSQAEGKGHDVVTLLIPDPDDYFVLKPKHTGFYSTSLDVSLGALGIQTLLLTGFAAICVLYTAKDAYMRDFKLVVAPDGVAAETKCSHDRALEHMRDRLRARVILSESIR